MGCNQVKKDRNNHNRINYTQILSIATKRNKSVTLNNVTVTAYRNITTHPVKGVLLRCFGYVLSGQFWAAFPILKVWAGVVTGPGSVRAARNIK
jgi:hypothetical protein